ncbi:MAG: anthranilate phosphoribosyltransferase [Bacteroidota bacterium]
MKNILNHLLSGRILDSGEASEALYIIGRGEANAAQMAAFITVYLMRPLSAEELAGFRMAMLELCIPFNLDGIPAIDMCGTGGDGKKTFNISTTSAFVVAGAGVPVAKHGNYGVSSSCGSSTVMEALGYKFTSDSSALLKQIEQAGICFLHAPLFHPVMKNVGAVRRDLGVRTFFNMLGPLVNPARPPFQMTGVFSLELARLYNYIFQNQNRPLQYSVVHSLDGYDEVSLTAPVRILSSSGERQPIPADFNSVTLQDTDLASGGSAAESADILVNILSGKGTLAQTNVVLANAALALQTADNALSLQDALALARESIDSGKALISLEKVISISAAA